MTDKNNQNFEPIAGQPGWYWDPKTGRTVSEEELGGHLEEFPNIQEDEEPYQMFDDEGNEQEDDNSEEEQGSDVENPEPSQNDNPRNEQPKTNSEPTFEDEGSPGDEPLDKFKKPTDALDALPTDKMGETGEKIEDAKKAVKLAKDIGEAIETEGASLANVAKDIEMAKEAEELAVKYGKEALKRQIIITLFAFLIVFGVPIAIVSLAFMGYGVDSASNLEGGTGSGTTTPKGKGYTLSNNTDYSATLCALGTTDSGLYTHPTEGFTIRLCGTAIGKVASINSQNIALMIQAAKMDGITLGGGSYRSYEEQVALRKQNCPNWETSRSSECSPPTAVAGNSMHEKGLATDFNNSSTRATNVFVWLSKNASTFGYFNYSPEPWHWSTSGG